MTEIWSDLILMNVQPCHISYNLLEHVLLPIIQDNLSFFIGQQKSSIGVFSICRSPSRFIFICTNEIKKLTSLLFMEHGTYRVNDCS